MCTQSIYNSLCPRSLFGCEAMELALGGSRYVQPGVKKNAYLEAVSCRRFTNIFMARRSGGTRHERSFESSSVDGLPNPSAGRAANISDHQAEQYTRPVSNPVEANSSRSSGWIEMIHCIPAGAVEIRCADAVRTPRQAVKNSGKVALVLTNR